MAQMQAEVRFDEDKCYIIKNGKKINIGHLNESKLFVVNTQPDYGQCHNNQSPIIEAMALQIWSPELWIHQ